MPKEIERKYLVKHEQLIPLLKNGQTIKQAYIPTENGITVRIRIKADKAFLTLKGKSTGISRDEFEYAIPVDEAETMFNNFCGEEKISKTRYNIEHGGLTWEVDVFEEHNKGLIVAEVELKSEDQEFDLPSWIESEVSDDDRYFNINLLRSPFTTWE